MKPVKVAMIRFAYKNHELIDLMTKRGTMIIK